MRWTYQEMILVLLSPPKVAEVAVHQFNKLSFLDAKVPVRGTIIQQTNWEIVWSPAKALILIWMMQGEEKQLKEDHSIMKEVIKTRQDQVMLVSLINSKARTSAAYQQGNRGSHWI